METMRRRWRGISALFLISVLLIGCAHQVEIIDHTVKAGKMKAGQAYTAPMDGWFISDEGIARILTAIEYYRFKWQECEAAR